MRTGCEKHGRKNPLPYSFSKRSHIGNLRRIRKQGKGRSSKRKENRRLSFLFAPAAGRGTFPPSADGESPPLRFSEKLSARKGRTRLRQFECPAQPVQRKEPPGKGEHANAVRAPRLFGAEKEPPVRGEHANAVRVPRFSGAEKEPPRQGEPASGSSRAPLGRCRKNFSKIFKKVDHSRSIFTSIRHRVEGGVCNYRRSAR